MSLESMFLSDPQGRRYADVLKDSRIDFRSVLALLDDPDRTRRMIESEIHHKRPALAGVVVELEAIPAIQTFFATNDGHTTIRARQAIGVAVRLLMEKNGFKTTGRKGTLGTRRPLTYSSSTPGTYQNGSECLAKWFTRAEHYEPAKKKWAPDEITARLNEIYSVEDSRLDPGFVEMQARSIGQEEW